MKKNFKYALLGAIVLTGAVGFSACQSSDEIVDVNPTYDPVENTVTTKFVLNISTDEAGKTRQTATVVQKNNNFRGMQDAQLIGLQTGKADTYLAPVVDASASGITVKQTYNMGTLFTNISNDADDVGDHKTNANKSSHRIVELSLPTGTDAMLVYGRAVNKSSNNTELSKDENGSVVMPTAYTTPANITFSLESRLGNRNTAFNNTEKIIAAILNRIMLCECGGRTAANSAAINGYTQEADVNGLKWRDYGELDADRLANLGSTAPLQQKLAKAYLTIQETFKTDDPHSGSATSVLGLVKDIYSIATSVYNATPVNDEELRAHLLADVILSRLNYYFTGLSGTPAFKELGDGSQDNTPKYHLLTNTTLQETDFTDVTDVILNSFPQSLDLPDGIAQIKFTYPINPEGKVITGGFAYKTTENTSSLIDLSSQLDPAKYMYPAELLYFDNSLLRVIDVDKDPDDYPEGYNNWDTGGTPNKWSGWSVGPVTSATRSVAVKNNINYGVALLQTNVVTSGTVTYTDNHSTDDNITYDEDDIKSLTLTGILIGGQYKQVGWNYLPTSVSNNTDFVIYDKTIENTAIPTTAPNYTLVFDNYANNTSETQDAQNKAQNNVCVALEFENGTEKDIYGKGGMIPKGSKFYLVGKLEVTQTVESLTTAVNTLADSSWPTTYAIPPYKTDGSSMEVSRVFIQDYVTSATFKIGAESLKHAYTTVPDLRATQTTLGLSVDLNWRPGITFDNIELGE